MCLRKMIVAIAATVSFACSANAATALPLPEELAWLVKDSKGAILVFYDAEGNAVSLERFDALRRTAPTSTLTAHTVDSRLVELRASLMPNARSPVPMTPAQRAEFRRAQGKDFAEVIVLDAKGWMISGAEFERQVKHRKFKVTVEDGSGAKGKVATFQVIE